ncbi:MAG: hypothetical protein WBL23_12400, partial [Salinisphaera sp.]
MAQRLQAGLEADLSRRRPLISSGFPHQQTSGVIDVSGQTKALFPCDDPLTNLTLVVFITGVISHAASIASEAFARA